jgi:hypothetical protein
MKEWKGIGQNSRRKERNEELTVKGVNMERKVSKKRKRCKEKRGRHKGRETERISHEEECGRGNNEVKGKKKREKEMKEEKGERGGREGNEK